MPTVVPVHGGESIRYNVSANKTKSIVNYVIFGANSKVEATQALAAEVPALDQELILDSLDVDHVEADIYEGAASYITFEWQEEKKQKEEKRKTPEIGEIEWDFDTTGGTQHVTTGLAPTQIFSAPGWNPMEFQRALDVSQTKSGYRVAGVTVKVPALDLTATTSFQANQITPEFIKSLARSTGKTNAQPWGSFDAGELLFGGARIKARTGQKTTITYSFVASENITAAHNLMIGGEAGAGGIGPVTKGGHQFMWTYFVNEKDNTQVLMKAKQVNVDTIYYSMDFSQLGLG